MKMKTEDLNMVMGPSCPHLRTGHFFKDDTTLKTESEEELKSLLMKEKEESEKAGLKLYS